MGLDLIVAADSRSGGQDGLAARAAAKLAGILLPRRHVGKISPEFTNLGAPGLYLSEAKVWEGLHIMCDPHVRSDRRNRARDGVRNDEGGHAQWSTPAWMRSRCAGLGSECKGVHERVWC